MGALQDVVVLLATDASFGARFRADPASFADEYGLTDEEVQRLLAMRNVEDDDSEQPSQLGARVSKSAIGASGMGALFHAFGGVSDHAVAHTAALAPSADTAAHVDPLTVHSADPPANPADPHSDSPAPAATPSDGTGHDGSTPASSSDGPGHEGPQPGDHVETSADGSTTTTHHADGSYLVTNNTTGTFSAYDSHGVMVEYTEHATTSFPPNAYALWDHNLTSGHDVTTASWDDAGGHHTAVHDPHGGNSWIDTAVSADGTHTVTTISVGDSDQYYTSEQVITAPDGSTTHITNDQYGHLISISGSGPTSWTDSTGHHDVVHNADGSTTTTSTAPDGSRTVLISTGGHAVSETSYDSSGHQTHDVTFNPDGSNGHATGTFTNADGTITTTYHADGTYTAVHNSDGTFITYSSHGTVIEYTEHATTSFPPNAYALWDHNLTSGHDVTTASWDDAGGHHTAVHDPHGGNSWIDTAVSADGTHTVTTISVGDSDQYYTSEQVITAPDGSVTDTTFDQSGHVISVTHPGAPTSPNPTASSASTPPSSGPSSGDTAAVPTSLHTVAPSVIHPVHAQPAPTDGDKIAPSVVPSNEGSLLSGQLHDLGGSSGDTSAAAHLPTGFPGGVSLLSQPSDGPTPASEVAAHGETTITDAKPVGKS